MVGACFIAHSPLLFSLVSSLLSFQVTLHATASLIDPELPKMSMGAICFTSSGSNGSRWVVLVFSFVPEKMCTWLTLARKKICDSHFFPHAACAFLPPPSPVSLHRLQQLHHSKTPKLPSNYPLFERPPKMWLKHGVVSFTM